MIKFFHVLSLISQGSLFFTLIPFLISKIEIGKEKRKFVFFIVFVSFAEIYSQTTRWFHINNVGATHIYYAIEFFFLFFILYDWEFRYKPYWLISGMIVGLVVLVDNFFVTPFSKFASFSASLQNFYMFLFSARLIILIATKNFIPFYRDERFYIAAGVFVYSSLSALMFLLYNVLDVILPFHISLISIVGENAFFAASMIIYYRQRKLLSLV